MACDVDEQKQRAMVQEHSGLIGERGSSMAYGIYHLRKEEGRHAQAHRYGITAGKGADAAVGRASPLREPSTG